LGASYSDNPSWHSVASDKTHCEPFENPNTTSKGICINPLLLSIIDYTVDRFVKVMI
jgi:hypothetical protein